MSGVEAKPAPVVGPITESQSQPKKPVGRRGRFVGGAAIVLALAAVGVGSVWLNAGTDHTPVATEAAPQESRVNVVVEPARMMDFERAVTVQGNVEAKRLALVSPRIAGPLDEIYVDDGDAVEAGQTRLFQTDPVKLAKTLEVRGHEVNVAENSLREKQASVEKSEAEFDKTEYDWKRYRDLYEKGASSDDELESAETEYRRSAAQLKLAGASVDLADAQLQQARSALAIAQKDLDDSLVVAPISGRVAERYQEPGEMGSPGSPVIRIEDPSLVEVSVFLPAQVFGEVTPGETEMHVRVNDVDLGKHAVSYKSPTIDVQLRTFEARCLLHDPPPAVAPGAMAYVRVVLERRQALGVPRDAIQQRGGRTVVFIVEDHVARMIPVVVGLETGGLVEVAAEELREETPVVAVGGYFLDPDAVVNVARESR